MKNKTRWLLSLLVAIVFLACQKEQVSKMQSLSSVSSNQLLKKYDTLFTSKIAMDKFKHILDSVYGRTWSVSLRRQISGVKPIGDILITKAVPYWVLFQFDQPFPMMNEQMKIAWLSGGPGTTPSNFQISTSSWGSGMGSWQQTSSPDPYVSGNTVVFTVFGTITTTFSFFGNLIPNVNQVMFTGWIQVSPDGTTATGSCKISKLN